MDSSGPEAEPEATAPHAPARALLPSQSSGEQALAHLSLGSWEILVRWMVFARILSQPKKFELQYHTYFIV